MSDDYHPVQKLFYTHPVHDIVSIADKKKITKALLNTNCVNILLPAAKNYVKYDINTLIDETVATTYGPICYNTSGLNENIIERFKNVKVFPSVYEKRLPLKTITGSLFIQHSGDVLPSLLMEGPICSSGQTGPRGSEPWSPLDLTKYEDVEIYNREKEQIIIDKIIADSTTANNTDLTSRFIVKDTITKSTETILEKIASKFRNVYNLKKPTTFEELKLLIIVDPKSYTTYIYEAIHELSIEVIDITINYNKDIDNEANKLLRKQLILYNFPFITKNIRDLCKFVPKHIYNGEYIFDNANGDVQKQELSLLYLKKLYEKVLADAELELIIQEPESKISN